MLPDYYEWVDVLKSVEHAETLVSTSRTIKVRAAGE
jgi:hypothetical protein